MFDHVHQEHFSAGEVTENFATIPVVQEQVIVQDIPEVVVPLPPAQEFSAPVYGHVHRVFVGLRPERLVDARGPQRCGRTTPSVEAPVLTVQSLRGFDGVDNTAAKFLLRKTLMKKYEEEEKERKRLERRQVLLNEFFALADVPLRHRSPQQVSRLEALAKVLDDELAAHPSQPSRRKRKKKRKRRTPRTSSHSSSRRAHRRQQQWYVHGWFCCFGISLAVFPSVVGRSQLPGVMDDSSLGALVFDPDSGICKAGFASFLALCSFTLSSGPRCSASWSVRTRRKVYSVLVSLVTMFLVLCSRLLLLRPRCSASWPALDRPGRFSCRGAHSDSHGLTVQKTTETPLLLLNTVIRASSIAPCIWQTCVRCSVFAFGVQDYGIS